MCEYQACHSKYPQDEFLCNTTWKLRNKAGKKSHSLDQADNGAMRVLYNHYLDAKQLQGRSNISRLCADDLQLLKQPLASFESKTATKCVIWGKIACFKCWECGVIPCCYKNRASLNTFCAVLTYMMTHLYVFWCMTRKTQILKTNFLMQKKWKILLTSGNGTYNIIDMGWTGMGINLGCIFMLSFWSIILSSEFYIIMVQNWFVKINVQVAIMPSKVQYLYILCINHSFQGRTNNEYIVTVSWVKWQNLRPHTVSQCMW